MKQVDEGTLAIYQHEGEYYMRVEAREMGKQTEEQGWELDHLWFHCHMVDASAVGGKGHIGCWVGVDRDTHYELDTALEQLKRMN